MKLVKKNNFVMNKTIFIPIEIKSRDYFPRLLISLMFASNGFDVYFGRKREIELLTKFFSKSFYLGLQTTRTYIPFYKKLKKKDFKILAYDEEGLVTLNDKIYLSTRASNEILDVVDYYLCWGKKQFNLINKKNLNNNKKKVINIGNPRIDILKKKYRPLFQDEINKIKIKDYILINMGFGHANHFLGKVKLNIRLETNKFINNKTEKKIYNKFREYRKKRFGLFMNTINKLVQNNPNQKFVIRPHPSEDYNHYSYLKSFSNVTVTKKYNAISWILKSKLILSDYCSTSIEAQMLCKPSLSYKVPKKISFLDKSFYDNSTKVKNFFELNKIVKKKSLKPKSISNLNKKLVNINNNFFSAKKLFDYLVKNNNFDKEKINFKNTIKYNFGRFLLTVYLIIFRNLYSEEKCDHINRSNLYYDVNKILKIEKSSSLKIKSACQSVFKIFS